MEERISETGRLYSIKATCEKLDVSLSTGRRMIKEGRLKAIRISEKLIRISDEEIDRFIQNAIKGSEE